MRELCDSVKGNVALFLFGFIFAVVLGLGTNAIGLILPSASASVLHWVKNCNPFLLAMVISSFNLMRRLDFKNKTINYISGLTLLIYIIHENIILRSYYRPWIWRYVYLNFGYKNLVLCTLCIAVVIFLFGTIASIIYDKTLRKAVASLSDKLYALLRGNYLKFENKALDK
jgi:hypothetical protein